MPPSRPYWEMPLGADDFAGLYDRHARALLAFLARSTADPEVAVDLLAETFAAAFEDRRRFRGGDPLPWLYGIRPPPARRLLPPRARGAARAYLERAVVDELP